MAKVAIECPGCQARLNLPDASKLGKKIRCPKCSESFVAEAAETEDGDDEPSRPHRRQRGGGAGRGAKPKAPAKSAAPVIIGGVAAVAVLAVAGLYFAGVFGGGDPPPPPAVAQPAPMPAPPATVTPPAPPAAPPAPPPENPAIRTLGLQWMPDKTELLVHLKVSDAWKAPLLTMLTQMPDAAAMASQLTAMTGLAIDDIESVTFGLAGLGDLVASGGSALAGRPDAGLVIRIRKTVSLDDLAGKLPGATFQEVGTQKFLLAQVGPTVMGAWFADPGTLVMGPPAQIQQFVEKGPRLAATIPPELLFADSSKQLLILAAPRDLKSLLSAVPQGPVPLPIQDAALTESFRALALGLTVRGGFDFQSTFLLKDATTAQKIKTDFDAGMANSQAEFDRVKGTQSPVIADVLGMVRSNLKAETRENVVTISTGVPDTAQQQLEQLPALLMMMAMTGGFGNPGAPGIPGLSPPGRSGPGAGPPPVDGVERYAGESAPVPAKNPSQLPPGLELWAITAWPPLPGDATGPSPVVLAIDVRGAAVGTVCGSGTVTVSSSRFAGGSSGKVFAGRLPPQLTRSIQQPGFLRVPVFLEAPDAAAGSLAEIKGTLPLAMAEEFEDFSIAAAPKTAKKPLQDPRLKAASVKLIKSSAGAGETMTLSCAKDFAILAPILVDPADPNRPAISFLPDTEKTQAVLRATSEAKFPEGLELKFRLAKGVQLVDVPFEFANLPLPAPATRPAAAPAPGGPQTTTTPSGTAPMAPPP